MSYTTILQIFPGEKVECGEKLKNSWGSAPYVWDFMGNKYILNFSMFRDQAMKDLWQLYKNAIVPAHQKAVLMMTFDKAYVIKENYAKAAKDIRLFLQDHNDTTVVNHWHHIAEVFESNPDVPAIGFWHTSVSVNPFTGDWDEQKEEYAPPNWDDCYEIYVELGKPLDPFVKGKVMTQKQYWLMDGRANYDVGAAYVLVCCSSLREAKKHINDYGADTCIVDAETQEVVASLMWRRLTKRAADGLKALREKELLEACEKTWRKFD